MKITIKKIACIVLVFIAALFCLVGCKSEQGGKGDLGSENKLEYLSDKKIGVVTGSIQAIQLPKLIPSADFLEFNTHADMIAAFTAKRVDAFSTDESVYKAMLWEGQAVNRIEEAIALSDYGMIFKKGEMLDLQAEVNEYIEKLKDNGKHRVLEEKWFSDSEPTEFDTYENLEGPNGTLKIGVCSSSKPFVYVKNGEYAGFEVELMIGFCREYGYKLEFEDTAFAAIMTGVASGKYTIGMSGITITNERKESVDFSNVSHTEDLVIVVPKQANAKKTLEDYQGDKVKVGFVTATYVSTFIEEIFPNAKFLEFSSATDMLLALTQGKIDICANDASLYSSMKWEGMNLDRLEEPYETSDYGIAFKKGKNQTIREEMNEFLQTIQENGKYEELQNKWFGDKEPTEFLDPSSLTGTRGTIKVVACNEVKPFGYIKNGKLVGYDIEFATMFAKEYGYKLEITGVSFPAVLSGLQAEMYDVAISGLTITEARKENIDFTIPYHREEVVFIIKGSDNTLEQFNGKKLGVVTGSLYGGYSREQFPNASIKEFNNFADVLFALKQGKVDGIMLDSPNFNAVAREDKKLSAIKVPAYSVEIGFGFQKTESGSALQVQMNAFLAAKKADGTVDALIEKWYGATEPNVTIPLETLSGNAKTLKVAIDSTRKPFVYLGKNNQPVGFEIEMLYLFCQEYGYKVELSDLSFASGIAGLATETYDMVCGGLYMTDERKQSVNFSDPYMLADVVMAKYERTGLENFFLSLKESFEKTFIRESRWQLIVEGVLTTLLISICAIIGGTGLGFGLYLLARSKNKWVSKITKGFAKAYSCFISGTPTLVILMILFYIVFGKSDIDGTAVAIIGFILIFSSFVYNQLSLTVGGVDKGQTEAAYALGYSRNQTFFRIILPQAMRMFLPTYSGEIVSLIKATSVVGYIAVNDLTKMGDIIRGSTYEAFFPLVAVAAIYFLIIWGVTLLLKFVLKKTEPKQRKNKNILKGVVR